MLKPLGGQYGLVFQGLGPKRTLFAHTNRFVAAGLENA
jgi:hypothetical protein